MTKKKKKPPAKRKVRIVIIEGTGDKLLRKFRAWINAH